MTINQLVALSFPLVTAAAVGLTALFVRRPWAEHRETSAEIAAQADEVLDSPLTATSPGRQELEQFLSETAEAIDHLLQSTETFRIRAHLVAEPPDRVKAPHA